MIANTQVERLSTTSTRRKWVLAFDSTVSLWHARQETFGYFNYTYSPTGYQYWDFKSGVPATVEEWLALRDVSNYGCSP